MKARSTVLLLALGLVSPLVHAQQLIGLYEFNGNLNNSVSGAGALDSLQVSNAGGATTGFSSGAWSWSGATHSPGTGLQLELGGSRSTYSIGIIFQYSQVNDYAKVLDFTNGTRDPGLYVNTGQFEPYVGGINRGGSVSADTQVTLVLTRDSSDWVYGYVNGSSTAAFSGLEADDYLVGSVWRFFMDDGGGEFSPAGSVYEIRIWDDALSSGQIATAFDPVVVPEPSTYAILAGLGALGLVVWRRRPASKIRLEA